MKFKIQLCERPAKLESGDNFNLFIDTNRISLKRKFVKNVIKKNLNENCNS